MKKFFTILVLSLVVAFTANSCSAYDYNNDPNYVSVTNAQGVIYFNLRTVNVQEYNPPYYQIAGWFVWTNGNSERHYEVVKRYNWNTKETYSRDEGYWRKDRTEYDDKASMRNRKHADALFRAAYGMDFYGY